MVNEYHELVFMKMGVRTMMELEERKDGIQVADAPVIKKPKDRELRRNEILKAALELFAKKGYEGTTMAEIAAATQQAVGTLYKFFKDKHDLYQALVAETVVDFENQLVNALRSQGDEVQRIHRFIEVGSQMFVLHLPMARVYFGHTAAAFLFAPAGLEDEAYKSYQRIVQALEGVFREGVASGKFTNIDPAVLALGLEGIHNGFLAALVRDASAFSPEQITDLTKRIFFGAILKQ